MLLKDLIVKHLHTLGDTDQYVAACLVQHSQEIASGTITEFEKNFHVSKSSLLRTLKKLGFSGFSEFKYSIKSEIHDEKVEKEDIFSSQYSDIEKTLSLLKTIDFSEITRQLFQAKHIYLYTTGFSQRAAAEEFIMQMIHLKRPIIFLSEKTELDLTMHMPEAGDVFMVSSLSGETDNIKTNLVELKMKGIEIISITSIGNNFFTKLADHSLYYYASEFKIYDVSDQIYSFVGLNILLDYLFRKCVEYYSLNIENEYTDVAKNITE
ncbi:MurR/RpiR family transcriptional regulator [Lactovum odontotermitis]